MNADDAAAFGRSMAAAAEKKMTEREEKIAETNFQGGYASGFRDAMKNVISLSRSGARWGLLFGLILGAVCGVGAVYLINGGI